jgi:hypothetical protein
MCFTGGWPAGWRRPWKSTTAYRALSIRLGTARNQAAPGSGSARQLCSRNIAMPPENTSAPITA